MECGQRKKPRVFQTAQVALVCSFQLGAVDAFGENVSESGEPRDDGSSTSSAEPDATPSSEFPLAREEQREPVRQAETEPSPETKAETTPPSTPSAGPDPATPSTQTPSTDAAEPSPTARLSPRIETPPAQPEEPPPPPLEEQKRQEPNSPAPAPLEFEPVREPTPFDQGRIRIGGGLSWTSTEDTSWTIVGLGLGVFVLDGFAVETDTTFWIGGDPFLATVTPGLRYVFVMVPTIKPYVGIFYRRYFISDTNDANAVGGRLGAFFLFGSGGSIGGGAVYEHIVERDVFVNRNQIYPELSFSLSF